MAEPSRSDPAKDPFGMIRIVPSCIIHRAELAWLRNNPREMPSHSWGGPQAWACRTQREAALQVDHRAGPIRELAQAGAATIETNLTLAADYLGFLIDPKPLSFSDKHIHLSCRAPIAACR